MTRTIGYILGLDVDFPGPISGQCIDGGIDTPTLMVFDIPVTLEGITLRLFDTEQVLNVERNIELAMVSTLDVISTNIPRSTNISSANLQLSPKPTRTKFPTVTYTATRTATIQIASTPTPKPTDIPVSSIFYAVGNANVRSCPRTNCEIVDRLATGDVVRVIGIEKGEAVSGNTTWRQISLNGKIAYVHSSLLSSSKPVVNSRGSSGNSGNTNPVVTSAPPIARPGNCSTAVAMGLTAEQAAQWSHLDRDKDGVACYGD